MSAYIHVLYFTWATVCRSLALALVDDVGDGLRPQSVVQRHQDPGVVVTRLLCHHPLGRGGGEGGEGRGEGEEAEDKAACSYSDSHFSSRYDLQ